VTHVVNCRASAAAGPSPGGRNLRVPEGAKEKGVIWGRGKGGIWDPTFSCLNKAKTSPMVTKSDIFLPHLLLTFLQHHPKNIASAHCKGWNLFVCQLWEPLNEWYKNMTVGISELLMRPNCSCNSLVVLSHSQNVSYRG